MFLKKYVLENEEYNTLDLINHVTAEYSFNWGYLDNINNTANQKIYDYSESILQKINFSNIVLDVVVSKAYLQKLLSYIPEYSRKDEYINIIYKAYEEELLNLDYEIQKLEKDLNISTAISTLNYLEDEYRIFNNINLGMIFRRNTIIAKRIAKNLNTNKESIIRYSHLFLLEDPKEIINKKKEFKIIIAYNSVNNFEYLQLFKEFIEEIIPAYYILEINIGGKIWQISK
ncbi:MAG: YmfQ family protein [Cetobacterium sp.]|nr:YmfQ family protein [Cetobacterium sp.]